MDRDQLYSQILQKITDVAALYYRLIIVIANQDDGAELKFDDIGGQMDLPVVNVNLELSKRMLELTKRQRISQTNKLMNRIVSDLEYETVLLNNIQLLFDPSLRQDPLRLLQNLSRRKTIVAVWDGQVQDHYLIYAEPEHPEYRRYPTRELVLIS